MIESELRDLWIEAVERLPVAAQVKALERLMAILAKKVPGRLRGVLEGMLELPDEEAPEELLAFRLQVRGLLSAAQDDRALAAAFIEVFPNDLAALKRAARRA
jgi:hypothetical protein